MIGMLYLPLDFEHTADHHILTCTYLKQSTFFGVKLFPTGNSTETRMYVIIAHVKGNHEKSAVFDT